MQKMKKVLALLLCVCMCATFFVPLGYAVDFTDVGADHKYYEAINYLASVGIINGFEDGSFKPEESVTRAQLAKIMAFALKNDNIVATQQIFTDVPTDHWAAGNIEAMVSLGIINGMGDGTFAPESPVLYEQAVKMTVCALGYDAVAQNNGGYPNGHMQVATARGFLRGISDGVMGQSANRGLIAQLIDNMLGIDQLDPVTGEVKKDSSSKADSNTDSAKGQVVATYRTGLTTALEEKCKKNEILVRYSDGDEEVFITDNLSDSVVAGISSYLGKLVTITYTEDDSGEYVITSITGQKNRNEEFSVKTKDLHDFEASTNTIEYYDEESGDFEKLSLTDNCYVIYNGKATTKSIADIMTELMTGDGTIDLLSSEGDNSYDVIFVKSYRTFIAGGSPTTSTTDDKNVVIYNKDNTADRIELPKESGTRTTVNYTLNGSKGTYSSITANSIVSVAISDDNTVFDVLISTTKKSNIVITALSTDDMTISLDGTEYDMAAMFKTYIENNPGIVVVQAKGEFSLDAFGKVAAMKVAASNYTYGYLTDIEEGSASSSRNTEPLMIQVYAIGSGTTINATTYGFKKSFYVNGVKYNTDSDEDIETVVALLQREANSFVDGEFIKGTTDVKTENHGYSQPIEFSVSGSTDNGYKAIDKLFTHSSATAGDTSLISAALVPATGYEAQKATCKTVGSGRNLGGYTVNSSSKIIVVPENKTDGKFYSRSYTWLSNNVDYNYVIYDATVAKVAGLVVIYESSASGNVVALSYENRPYIVVETGIRKTDNNGEEVEAIKVVNGIDGSELELHKGDETEVYTVKLDNGHYVKDADTTITYEDLKEGDIIRFIKNEDNSFADIEVVMQAENMVAQSRGIDTNSATVNNDYADVPYRTFVGTAKIWDRDSNPNVLVVTPALLEDIESVDVTEEETWTMGSGVKYYVFDSSQTDKDNRFVTGDSGSLIDYNVAPGEASEFFAFIQSGTVKYVVVYK